MTNLERKLVQLFPHIAEQAQISIQEGRRGPLGNGTLLRVIPNNIHAASLEAFFYEPSISVTVGSHSSTELDMRQGQDYAFERLMDIFRTIIEKGATEHRVLNRKGEIVHSAMKVDANGNAFQLHYGSIFMNPLKRKLEKRITYQPY
jgi:hypothetical protein